jgi:hypothetical protein
LQKSFIAIIGTTFGGREGVQYTQLGGIVVYIITEIDIGSGGGHFESIDCPLELEAALMLS